MSTRPFEGYEDVVRVRSLGALDYFAAKDARSGEDRILVAAAAGASSEVRKVLTGIAHAHSVVNHPWVPRVAQALPHLVALRGSVATDLEALTEVALRTGYRFTQEGAPAFVIECLEMLDVAHTLVEPQSGLPLCLGAFASANVLLSAEGDIHFLGWGHPHDKGTRARLLPGIASSYVAPEVSFGAAPRPGSDLAAAALFFHSFVHLGRLQPEVVALLGGESVDGRERLQALIVDLFSNSGAPSPEERSIRRFLESFRSVLAELGVVADLALLQRELAELIRAGQGRDRLVIGEEGRWFRVGDEKRVPLHSRGPVRRVLALLARTRREQADRAVSLKALFAVGWPGEVASPESARNRVYVTIAQLRSLGLRDHIVRRDDGYLIDPKVWFEIGAE